MKMRKQNTEWFIQALVSGNAILDTDTAKHMASQLNVSLEGSYFCVVVRYKNEEKWHTDANAVVLLNQVCSAAGKHMDAYVTGYIGNQLYIVMVFCESHKKESAIAKLKRDIEKNCGNPVQLGVGKSYREIEKLNYSRIEAYEALSLIGGYADIAYIEDLYLTQSVTSRKLEQEKQQIIALYKRGDMQCVMEKVTQLVEKVRVESPVREGTPYPTSIRRTIVELLVDIMHICADAGVDVDKELNYQDPYRSVFELKTTPDILQWFSETVYHLYKRVQERNIVTEKNMLTLAKKCVGEHIGDPGLSLSLVSEELGITAPYFSAFFIRENGMGFNEYVTNIRVERAKDFLRDTNQKIGEVAANCGFRSSSYFISVFRRQTGMSPGEYRNTKK